MLVPCTVLNIIVCLCIYVDIWSHQPLDVIKIFIHSYNIFPYTAISVYFCLLASASDVDPIYEGGFICCLNRTASSLELTISISLPIALRQSDRLKRRTFTSLKIPPHLLAAYSLSRLVAEHR